MFIKILFSLTIHLKQSKWYISPKALTNWPLITFPHAIHTFEVFSFSPGAFGLVRALLFELLVVVVVAVVVVVVLLVFVLFISK